VRLHCSTLTDSGLRLLPKVDAINIVAWCKHIYYPAPMNPNKHDVENMVAALMTSLRSVERARRQGDASRLAALYVIAAQPESSPKGISEELGLHPSSVTRQIQALEQDGHVKVKADPADGRSCRVSLTASGKAEIERLRQVGLQRFASFVAKWDAEEVRTLTRLLTKLEVSKSEVNRRGNLSRARWRRQEKD
jgi:DNA-binding MarR family transcriptional regulator